MLYRFGLVPSIMSTIPKTTRTTGARTAPKIPLPPARDPSKSDTTVKSTLEKVTSRPARKKSVSRTQRPPCAPPFIAYERRGTGQDELDRYRRPASVTS